jgi:anti-anti-sigma factor
MATEWSDEIVVVDLADEPALSEELSSAIDRVDRGAEGHVPHIVLNFGGVSYVNSSNLADLLRLRKGLAARGRQLRLCSVADEVWQVMMVTGLDKVLRFAPDPLTALAALQMEDSGG